MINRPVVVAAMIACTPAMASANDLIVTTESFGRSAYAATIVVNIYNPLDRAIDMAFFECWSIDQSGKTIELGTGIARNIKPRSNVKADVSFTRNVGAIASGACRFSRVSTRDTK